MDDKLREFYSSSQHYRSRLVSSHSENGAGRKIEGSTDESAATRTE